MRLTKTPIFAAQDVTLDAAAVRGHHELGQSQFCLPKAVIVALLAGQAVHLRASEIVVRAVH